MTTPWQPSPAEPVDPDNALADLEADFTGLVAPPDVVVIEDEPPPIGRSWAFDFIAQRFVQGRSANGALHTNGIATLIQWCEACLRTARGAHPIYPPWYGLRDRNALLGKTFDGAPVAELEARIREALTAHDRITDITDFAYEFDTSGEAVMISFTVVLDDDTLVPLNTTLGIPTQEF